MQFSLKVCVAVLFSSLAFSCGVLEQSPSSSSPHSEPSPVLLPTTSVTPLISASGNLVAAGGDSPSTVAINSKEITSSNQPQVLAATDSEVKNVTNVFQTDRCNTLSRGGFIWFTDQVGLNDWLSPLDADEAEQIVSKIDFSKQGALLLDYGIASSKGAGASIVDSKLEIKGQEAFVRVKQFKAPKNKKSVQVVTHPCSLFVMPRTGFTTLVVLSDLNDKLMSFENK